jgi:(p)ppGpp synthase/HD superfamily hydrolase
LTELDTAERIARSAHEHQIEESTGDPYITHVERVVALVTAAGASDAVKAVAWLHDVIEDTDWTRAMLVERAGITAKVADAVEILTRQKALESYDQYIDRVVRSGSSMALQVKLADLQDHLRPNCPRHLRDRYERALPLFLEQAGCALVRRGGDPV